MSFIHITIKLKRSNEWHCIFKDLSVADLKKKFVKPYKLGKSIFHDGNILSPAEITQIKITETKRSHEQELKSVQEDSLRKTQEFNRTITNGGILSIGHGYNDYEINECGNEVTDSYIFGGPGTGTTITAIAEFIKHPWVVRVVGGLVFVAVATYLGFK